MGVPTHKIHMFMVSIADERDAKTVKDQITYALNGTSLTASNYLRVSHMTSVDVVDDAYSYSEEIPPPQKKSLIGQIRGKFYRPKS